MGISRRTLHRKLIQWPELDVSKSGAGNNVYRLEFDSANDEDKKRRSTRIISPLRPITHASPHCVLFFCLSTVLHAQEIHGCIRFVG